MRPPCHPRRGLTLVEVMIALVLVAIGLLGVAGSSALMLRAVTAHGGTLHAVRLAGLRLARLGAEGCAAARGGSATHLPSGTQEAWVVHHGAPGAVLVDDSIAWVGAGGTRQLVVRSALLC